MKNFRLLREDEIDCRVAQVVSRASGPAATVLLYKDARVDQNILDEVFGLFGWQRRHEVVGGNLYCTVSILNPATGEWISKQDVGVESNSEAEKGQASDAFKRACFNWGIGRELYTAPRIVIPLQTGEYKEQAGKIKSFATFAVKSIGYDDKENITALEIMDGKGVVRYRLGAGITASPATPVKPAISPAAFAKAVTRMMAGEDLAENLRETFSLTEKQNEIIDKYNKHNNR